MPTVRVNDINMYYEIHGEGEPLILIHGTCFDTSAWARQMPSFSQRYRVVVFDNRGTGRTDTTRPPYTIEQMADDTAGFIDTIGIDRTHILGYSLGGLIAQELAIKHPERVKGIVLAGSYGKLTPIGLERTKLLMRMLKEGCNHEIAVRNFFLWFYSDRFFENEGQVNLAVSDFLSLLSPGTLEGLEGQVQAILHYDGRHRLPQITAPTLVVVGKDDILTPLKLAEELTATIPNSELIILEDAAHSLIFESPERFNQIVLDFLNKV